MTLLSLLFVNLGLGVCGLHPCDAAAPGVNLDPDDLLMVRHPGLIAFTMPAEPDAPVEPCHRLTLHLVVQDAEGRELANSRRRGLPLTVELEPLGFWDRIAQGLAKGDRRVVFVPVEHGFGEMGVPGIVPPQAELWIEIEAVESFPRTRRSGR